ncbi:PREDICTED: dual specificity protein phosphatase 23-like isoform X1 [Branchiostoma belcheri]|uniref:Dual specificity protein phosphatase 23 n=2 Tax=Branchiostoma belcheri TaxID=7741 RepID=A0A6P4ZCH3_BRABE|nr:PREDICTED: dual specificity protein phosphatase 23-like isoform X1 [Branchiostoma belcheri]
MAVRLCRHYQRVRNSCGSSYSTGLPVLVRPVNMAERPSSFSWVVQGKLCALAFPHRAENIRWLYKEGVRHLISLTYRLPPVDSCPKLNSIHMKIEDFTPPTIEQVDRFIHIVESNSRIGEAVAVHCQWGRGRTGTMIACYFVKTRKISGQEAIEEIRRIRPGSIETYDQEKMVIQYYQQLKSRGEV